MTIRPDKAKVIKFTGQDGELVFRKYATLKPRPFMTDSSNSFDFTGNIMNVADKMIDRQIAKDLKDLGNGL